MSIQVYDFFSGCGGTSKGFENAGLEPVFALDFDVDAGLTFQVNFPTVRFERKNITRFNTKAIEELVDSSGDSPKLFCGCAPCQPFTRQNTIRKKVDQRAPLLNSFKRFVERYRPEYVFVENVPGLQNMPESGPLGAFIKSLRKLGYQYDYGVIAAQDYGIPQRRRRLVLIASLMGHVSLPAPTHGQGRIKAHSTVREWISDLPEIGAGAEHPVIPNHRAAALSHKNLDRIKHTPQGGGRQDWPEHLRLECHTKRGYSGHTDVYGRMKWDRPATGLTTRCISLSNGRFGHPVQNRAISVREAACLQTFPEDFVFHGSLNSQARQVGNAVPVLLAETLGKYFISHWENYQRGTDGKV